MIIPVYNFMYVCSHCPIITSAQIQVVFVCFHVHVCMCTYVNVSWRIFWCFIMIKQFCFFVWTNTDCVFVCVSMTHIVWLKIFLQKNLSWDAYSSSYCTPHIWCTEIWKIQVVFCVYDKCNLGQQLWVDRNLTARCSCTSLTVFENIWVCESRCTAKFVGCVSQSTALMDSLHASLGLIFSPLHLLLPCAVLSLCPLMHLDHC